MTTTIPTTTGLSTETLIHELIVQQRAIDRAEDRAQALKAQLVERLGVDGKAESDEAKVAVVVSHTPVIDVDALKAAATKGVFYKLTKRVPDMVTFKALTALGQVPPEVQEIVGERVSKPSVRLTMKVR